VLGMYAADVRERPNEAKIDDALGLEALARAYDPRIVNSGGSHVVDVVATIALANSNGFHGTYRSTQVTRDSAPIAQDGASKRSAHYGSAARGYASVEAVDAIARTAARRAVDMCGARKPQTMRCSVIFERDIAALVLSDVFSALNAANVAVGNSFLIGKVGHKIGSDLVTIFDDGTLVGGLGSAPFDSEGMPTRRTVVFRDGVLETFLYDTYYGRKLGAASTGNASSGGIGPTNFYLQVGPTSLAALIASTARGVLIVDTIGFSTESVTGTYSRGARGFMIENGEPFDLLFTDVIMPGGMTGRQLADETVKRRPGIKVLYTSGYTDSAIVHHGRLDAGVLLLTKPYRKSQLAKMVRLALEDEA